jgi:hypothetical protein
MANLSNYIEWFNGNMDDYNKVMRVFNNPKNFLQLIVKKGLQDEISIYEIPTEAYEEDVTLLDYLHQNGFLSDINVRHLADELQNRFILWWLQREPKSCLKFICDNLLTDVDERGDEYWLRLSGRDELEKFFRDYRRDTSPFDIARRVLSEDSEFYDVFNNTTDDVYSDVIEELDDTNLQHLAKYIMNSIGNQDLNIEEYGSDFFHELMSEQGREDFFQIRNEDVYNLIKDEEAMNELLKGDLSDLRSDLYSIHNNAYNGAYGDECYNMVMDGLQEFFSSKISEEQTKVRDKTRYIPYIRIKHFDYDVKAYLENNLGSNWTLDYFGSYTAMMDNLFEDEVFEKISFRIPDYPDYELVQNQINDIFTSYI